MQKAINLNTAKNLTNVWMSVHMYTYMYVYVCVYIYTYTDPKIKTRTSHLSFSHGQYTFG